MAVDIIARERNVLGIVDLAVDPVDFLETAVPSDHLTCPLFQIGLDANDGIDFSIVNNHFYTHEGGVDDEHFLHRFIAGDPHGDLRDVLAAEEIPPDRWEYAGVNALNRQPDHRAFYISAPKMVELVRLFNEAAGQLEFLGLEEETARIVAARHWDRLNNEEEGDLDARVRRVNQIFQEAVAASSREEVKRAYEEASHLPKFVEVLPMPVLARLHTSIRRLPDDHLVRRVFEDRINNEVLGDDFAIPDDAPPRPLPPLCPEFGGPIEDDLEAPAAAVPVAVGEVEGAEEVPAAPDRGERVPPYAEPVLVRVVKEVAKKAFNTLVYIASPFVFLANLLRTWSFERAYTDTVAVINGVVFE